MDNAGHPRFHCLGIVLILLPVAAARFETGQPVSKRAAAAAAKTSSRHSYNRREIVCSCVWKPIVHYEHGSQPQKGL